MNVSVYQLPNRVQVTREIPLERWMPRFQPSAWLLSKASCEDMEYHRVKTATIQALVDSDHVRLKSSNRVWEWKRRRDGSSDRVPVWELVYEIC